MDTLPIQASARFGLGPSLTEINKIKSDPKGWLKEQIQRAHIPKELQYLQDPLPTEILYLDFEKKVREKKESKNAGIPDAQFPNDNPQRLLREAFLKQSSDRFLAQIASEQPFIERMVLFWSNHFTVSIKKPRLMGIVDPYEVEAIRPHVTGRFVDMLIAVIQHPAMLIYLDNTTSIGPNSIAGIKRNKSINENLGREILELHTLGVDGGYTQQDVIALANIITGWTLDREGEDIYMRFHFNERMHEPGSKTLLGKTYSESGVDEGIQALHDLARHPATAKHIATKLARHFISDDPPASAIEVLSKVFINTEGNLSKVYQALINLKEAWDNPLAKFKTSYEFVISALRLRDLKLNQQQIVRTLRAIDIIPFNAPSPAGLPDSANFWAGSDAILKRIEWSRIISEHASDELNPSILAEQIFGSLLHEETRTIISGAPSPRDAFAFLLVSPEFQRR